MFYNEPKYLEHNNSIIIYIVIIRRSVIARERVLAVLRLAAVLEVIIQVSQPPLLYPWPGGLPDVFEAL